jgi:hypothetical protein
MCSFLFTFPRSPYFLSSFFFHCRGLAFRTRVCGGEGGCRAGILMVEKQRLQEIVLCLHEKWSLKFEKHICYHFCLIHTVRLDHIKCHKPKFHVIQGILLWKTNATFIKLKFSHSLRLTKGNKYSSSDYLISFIVALFIGSTCSICFKRLITEGFKYWGV